MGDDGSVGRGNRANGLITPNRPMSMEATSGKNPINHVGKIYNLLSNEMAIDITKKVEGVKQVHIMTLSQIGKPIDYNLSCQPEIIPEPVVYIDAVKKLILKRRSFTPSQIWGRKIRMTNNMAHLPAKFRQ